MNLIVAVDENWGIGYKGDLLARVREDLKNFRRVTDGKTVVYGSNTLSTFPGGRVLPNRTNIVLNWNPDYAPEGAIVVHSLEELFAELKQYSREDVFVIGGASVYNQLLPYCDKAYVTKFRKCFESDVWIPDLDAAEDWKVAWAQEPVSVEDADFLIQFMLYERVKGDCAAPKASD